MKLAIMLLTAGTTPERTEYAVKSLESVLNHLDDISPDDVRIHVADDGSSEEHRSRLLTLAGHYINEKHISSSNSEGRGYGASYNLGTQVLHVRLDPGDMVLPLEDDWVLQEGAQLRIGEIYQALEEKLFGCVRLGYIGYTQSLRGEFVWAAKKQWLLLDPDSPEPHVFAGHPRIETVEWERSVGPWPEGLAPGDTEFAVAHLRAARTGVVWPVDLVHPYGSLFGHIGAVRSY